MDIWYTHVCKQILLAPAGGTLSSPVTPLQCMKSLGSTPEADPEVLGPRLRTGSLSPGQQGAIRGTDQSPS